jgi:hypothetical protein
MVRFHAALGMTWKQRAHPCVSTGRSIHAAFEHNTVAEGRIDKRAASGPDKGHGTWRLEGDQLVLRWANGGFSATITKENESLHGVRSGGYESWGKPCK